VGINKEGDKGKKKIRMLTIVADPASCGTGCATLPFITIQPYINPFKRALFLKSAHDLLKSEARIWL
jgi:hypothetical protein